LRKGPIRLADGRELVYYDHEGAPARTGIDARELESRPSDSELRYDPLLDVWVMVAAHRQERTYLPAAEDCPLCPSRPGHPSEIPASDYGVVVLENRFPALAGTEASAVDLDAPGAAGPLLQRPGTGRCEVVCFSPVHDASFVDLSVADTTLVLEAWADRTRVLSSIPAIEQVFCFENRGTEIGVTLQHPHGQIYAYPFVTPRTTRMLASAEAHFRRTGRNLFEDVLAAEEHDGSRIVVANRSWVAFVPHAARWPFEVHCYPRRRIADLTSLDKEQHEDFPSLYLDLLARFDQLFDGQVPYISAWHQAPVRVGRAMAALHLELFTVRRSVEKLKYLAASESAMDAFANDVVPEQAAERLRELAS
jgi:UDPglucose--hexose-1-phosphate uridylyltransferase